VLTRARYRYSPNVSWVAWRDAWDQALYAAGRGFYVTRGGPVAHFSTAAHGPTGPVLAEAMLRLWDRYRPGTLPSLVVDVGAGRGALAAHLAETLTAAALTYSAERSVRGRTGRYTAPFDPERTVRGGEGGGEGAGVSGVAPVRVVAVDVVDRPEGLDERVDWLRSPGGSHLPEELASLEDALVIAHEWLDVVPCTIAEVRADGLLVEVLVDPETGDERLGPPVSDADRAWSDRHWPARHPGDRVEVGRSRDDAWADLVSRVDSGLLVAVDYGHSRSERPSGGTLAAYEQGRQRHPVPDGTCDLTAHVAMDSLAADVLTRQRALLGSLGMTGALPAHSLAGQDPLAYVRALERASAEARLIEPAGFGGFWWAVRPVQTQDVP
jgi:SAM-dependent MidA family methyltransferase